MSIELEGVLGAFWKNKESSIFWLGMIVQFIYDHQGNDLQILLILKL